MRPHAFIHLHASGSIIDSHLLPLPEYMSVFDAELYAASCALQYAANLSPDPKVVSLSIDSQAALSTISQPGYSYSAPLLHDIRKATSSLHLSNTAVQVGWIPSHTGITGNELADAAAKLAAEGTPSDDFPWSYLHLCSQIRGQLLREWQVWHKPRDDFPFSPATKLSAIFTLTRHAATRHFQMKLAASYLLGHPNWHRPDPGLCPRCEEEIEAAEHALLRCPARQYARGSLSGTLDLKSAWYDTTAIEMLAAFVQRTLTAYPPGFTPPEVNGTHASPSSPSPYSARLVSALLYLSLLLRLYSRSCFLGSFFWFFFFFFFGVLFWCSFMGLSLLILNAWWRFLGAITTGCMRPFVPRTNENEIRTTTI